MKYRSLMPLIGAAITLSYASASNHAAAQSIDSIIASDSAAIHDTARTSTLTDKQRFYKSMKEDGWEFLFNNPKDDDGIVRELRNDYEYKIMPKAWEYPDYPDKPSIRLDDLNSIWRRKRHTPNPTPKHAPRNTPHTLFDMLPDYPITGVYHASEPSDA